MARILAGVALLVALVAGVTLALRGADEPPRFFPAEIDLTLTFADGTVQALHFNQVKRRAGYPEADPLAPCQPLMRGGIIASPAENPLENGTFMTSYEGLLDGQPAYTIGLIYDTAWTETPPVDESAVQRFYLFSPQTNDPDFPQSIASGEVTTEPGQWVIALDWDFTPGSAREGGRVNNLWRHPATGKAAIVTRVQASARTSVPRDYYAASGKITPCP
ncbi:MAG: hypothetical protein Q4G26_15545 [Paracoccus sp. (in: a-proteobacteria)]|nr:hypothetical protein [Paracoccus sp. (in: a-proteobacteria)]